uniref:zinc finger protein with KRAB and SCAN domains 7-like n=1 Tax=Euleptes europaea TaxID=460621 RepID=UPI002541A24C|nr:zinc finger protein with KRAB and SCAN domains 7-like [Euleptes europaea]
MRRSPEPKHGSSWPCRRQKLKLLCSAPQPARPSAAVLAHAHQQPPLLACPNLAPQHLASARLHPAHREWRPSSPGAAQRPQLISPHSVGKEAILSPLLSREEARSQSFHAGAIPSGDTPRETLSRLSLAARQWLRPQEYSKEQIVDLVILEQFLFVLPTDMGAWVRAKEPDSSKEAAQLAEAYLQEQEAAKPAQLPITFEDVTVTFTEKEWALLDAKEKALYWEIMQDNYDNVASLAENSPAKAENSLVRENPKNNSQLKDPELAEKQSMLCGLSDGSPRKAEAGGSRWMTQALESFPLQQDKMLFDSGKLFKEPPQVVAALKDDLQEAHICTECGKSCRSFTALTKHHRAHKVEKCYKCSVCEKRFNRSSNLIVHQRIHTGLKPFQCADCEKSFNNKSTLIKHQRTHTGEKPYVCLDCGKGFTQSSNLIKHQRIHTGVKPYKCPDCDRSFTQSSHFIDHQRIHTGERPYKCPDCGKGFSLCSSLIIHHRIHTGEKPFECPVCEKSFSSRSTLINHRRIHTRDKPYECAD